MEVHKVFVYWKTTYHKDINLPELIYILNTILSKPKRHGKLIVKFYENSKRVGKALSQK